MSGLVQLIFPDWPRTHQQHCSKADKTCQFFVTVWDFMLKYGALKTIKNTFEIHLMKAIVTHHS
jgi:hypothetical protein